MPAFDRLVGNGVIKLEKTSDDAIIVRPKLIEAFNEVRRYGVPIDTLINVHEQVVPLLDQISSILVRAGVEQVSEKIKPGESLPADTEVAELITMLIQFRTQAVSRGERDTGRLDRGDHRIGRQSDADRVRREGCHQPCRADIKLPLFA